MTANDMQWLVISDLDGTLLNHDSYAVDEALPAIRLLKEKQIPIIFNTSKTWAETLSIRQALDIHDPFIVENGSCIYCPKIQFTDAPPTAVSRDAYWATTIGQSIGDIRAILNSIDTPQTHYTRLSDCTIDEAVSLTGLSPEQACQAVDREFSEPLIWHKDEVALAEFKHQLSTHKLTTLKGGRFLHVLGECDKGLAARLLKQYYPVPVSTIVLGDSPNDTAMLDMADISIIVRSPSSHLLSDLVEADIQTTAVAPAGWTEGIKKALSKTGQNQDINDE